MSRICTPALTLLLAAAILVHAGPNKAQLRAFRAVVPEHSKTCGGSEPDLSPDGKTLAFRSYVGDVWVRHGVSLRYDREQDGTESLPTWKLDVYPPVPEESSGGCSPTTHRSIDWSPDGKRLAFVSRDGRLCIAEGFDFESKLAQVRVLVVPPPPKAENDATWFESVHWSPDGTKIAYVKSHYFPRPSEVMVIDVASGEETELADNADSGPDVWVQPWSPDGRSLTYASRKCIMERDSDKVKETLSDIHIVSVDGKTRWQITSGGQNSSPAWSPTGNRIVFSATKAYKYKLGSGVGIWESVVEGRTDFLYVADVDGRKVKVYPLTTMPTQESLKTALEKNVRVTFEREFGAKLTTAQLNQLRAGKMGGQEMSNLAALCTAKGMGGEVGRKADALMKAFARDPKMDFGTPLWKVLEKLPESKQSEFAFKSSDWMDKALSLDESQLPTGGESHPVWSPDGKHLAYLRHDHEANEKQLYVLEVAARQRRRAFAAHEIGSVGWTRDGTSLLLESTRVMGELARKDGTLVETGYPEIWLLTLRAD